MKNRNYKFKKIYLLLFIILVCCFLYLESSIAYTSYESNVTSKVESGVGKFKILINGVDVTTPDNDGNINSVILNNIVWNSTHTREGKIAPGASGTINLELDPSGSEVAILYDFILIDKKIDEDKLLTFTSINSSNGNIIRTLENKYTGIISLDDIENNKKIDFNINFYFENLTDIEAISEDNGNLDDFFTIQFHAIQYNGEKISPYTE